MTVDVGRAASEQYGRIIDDFAVITSDYPAEHDFGCAAFATRALLARRPDGAYRNHRIDRWLALLDDREPHSAFRPRKGLLGQDVRRFGSTSFLLMHEGYLHDPVDECAAEIEVLRAELGQRFWAVSPDLWSAWGSKAQFRPRCQEILGDGSVPPGIEGVASDVGDVIALLKQFQAETSGLAVVKLPGSGGFANVIVEPGQVDAEAIIESLWADHVPHIRPVDVVIESWLPWDSTHSLSFLLSRDQPPVLLATCDQVVDADGVFVGSRSELSLGAHDTESVLDRVRRLVDAMASDEYVGVAAIDVIIGSPDAWGGIGLALPSGQRMIVIECNPRFNYHNKIGLVVERFARVWGIPSHDLRWAQRERRGRRASHGRGTAGVTPARRRDRRTSAAGSGSTVSPAVRAPHREGRRADRSGSAHPDESVLKSTPPFVARTRPFVVARSPHGDSSGRALPQHPRCELAHTPDRSYGRRGGTVPPSCHRREVNPCGREDLARGARGVPTHQRDG